MEKEKTRVGILCGGKSAEHEVSLRSAKNVIDAIDVHEFETVVIVIDASGTWIMPHSYEFFLDTHDSKYKALHDIAHDEVTLVPNKGGSLFHTTTGTILHHLDVVFPILHGPFGEDGSVQGLLTLAGVPFVGAGVLGSAVGMDKDAMKRLLQQAHIPVGEYIAFAHHEPIDYDKITATLGLPLFIKPANLGSSVGVHKVSTQTAFEDAIRDAFTYDNKILIEKYIKGRELECAILGNDTSQASVVGEVIPAHEFYSYDAKYTDEHGALLEIPAKISPETQKSIQGLALKVFTTLSCAGLGRIDFFLEEDGNILVNEINTIPGFTAISMYPKLWEASGISYKDLITKLISYAFERHEQATRLLTTIRSSKTAILTE